MECFGDYCWESEEFCVAIHGEQAVMTLFHQKKQKVENCGNSYDIANQKKTIDIEINEIMIKFEQ